MLEDSWPQQNQEIFANIIGSSIPPSSEWRSLIDANKTPYALLPGYRWCSQNKSATKSTFPDIRLPKLKWTALWYTPLVITLRSEPPFTTWNQWIKQKTGNKMIISQENKALQKN
jgi:hypothetical protein